jgi:hypothetical protein
MAAVTGACLEAPRLDLQHQLLLMALGWLARENKLKFVQDRRSLKVSLKGH